MMTRPVSVQLFSVREAMNEDTWGTIERIASMGYPGVEPCNVPGGDPQAAGRRFADLGLAVNAYQAGIPVGEKKNQLLDEAAAMGASHLVCPFYDVANFASVEALRQTAALFNEASANCAERGMTFGYHNHDFELSTQLDGKPALVALAELTDNLYFTVDTYWVQVGGESPVDILHKFGARANLLHIKDGPLEKSEAMTAVGAGRMDFPPIVEAGADAKWLVVEIDRCETDMMEAVQQSLNYLVDAGLGRTTV